MTDTRIIRQELVNMLMLRQAHMIFEDAVENFPADAYNMVPPPLSYSFWHLLEHIRICQVDILDYMTKPDEYQMLDFPDGYWPDTNSQCTPEQWQATIDQFYADRQALVDLILASETDLQAQIPRAETGHTVAREIIIIGQHNAYHIGEFGILRQIYNLW